MKKNLFTKILACSMAFAMLTGTALTVSAVETDNQNSTVTGAFDENEYQKRLDMLHGEFGDREFLQNDEYYYDINYGGTVSLFFYKGHEQNVIIPSEIDGMTVTGINWPTFNGYSGLKSVVIPDTVTLIGLCFGECTGLEEITIPKSVTYILDGSFAGCTSLKNIYVDSENPMYSSIDGVLTNKAQTKLVAFPGGKKGSYTVPESIESLSDLAFDGCANLTEITLPDKVKGISAYAFRNCTQLQKINYSDTLTGIAWQAFTNCTSLHQIYIPKTVSNIYGSAFNGCDHLTIYGEKDSYAETYAKRYNIPFEYTFSNTSTISANTIIIGKTVTVNAGAVAGKGNYTYAVYYKKNSEKKWTVKQDYSENPTVSIKPAKATDYQICVKVKDSSGKVVKKYFDLSVVTKLSNISYISSDSITKGSTIIAKCSATGGKGNYTYAVYYKKAIESKWTLKQDFNKNSDVIIRPANSLEYDICIKAKDEMGTVAKKYFKLNVSEPLSNTNTSSLSASVINLGESATINCSSTIPDCQYKAVYQSAYGSPDRIRKILQDYSTNTQITFKPDKKGICRICITAKSPDGHLAEKFIFLKVE